MDTPLFLSVFVGGNPAKNAAKACALAALTMLVVLCGGCNRQASSAGGGAGKIKIGFLVKQPEEPWFQLEWKFAQQAADQYHFDLVKIAAPDGEKTLAAIDNLAAQGAQGFVICTPDVRLGPAIAAKAQADNLKVMSVDDQFLGADGKPMADVPHLGISAREIGRLVGQQLAAEMKRRGWSADDTALCVVSFDELDTARQRTDGATEALAEAGFPKGKMYRAPQKTSDVPGAFDAANVLLTQHADAKRWLVCGMNDSAVMGAVRAMEGRGFGAENVVGVGIDGTDALMELRKDKPTGFFGSILLTPKRHGFETAEMMYRWIKDGAAPPKTTFTSGTFITRDDFERVMKEQGVL